MGKAREDGKPERREGQRGERVMLQGQQMKMIKGCTEGLLGTLCRLKNSAEVGTKEGKEDPSADDKMMIMMLRRLSSCGYLAEGQANARSINKPSLLLQVKPRKQLVPSI